MRTKSVNIYKFDELSSAAKEKARQWWRDGAFQDKWYEAVYEDAERVAEILGITFDQRPYQTVGGKTRYEVAIFFSGFSCQGDGACFEGRYSYAKGSAKSIRAYCNDERLISIADNLQELQKRHRYKLWAKVKHSGHYQHSRCTDIEVGLDDDRELESSAECGVAELLRDFMNWIYDQLEEEYWHQSSDEYVDESILANDYEFTEDGEIE